LQQISKKVSKLSRELTKVTKLESVRSADGILTTVISCRSLHLLLFLYVGVMARSEVGASPIVFRVGDNILDVCVR